MTVAQQRKTAVSVCVNGVRVKEDPRVKCENIWQQRCWQESLGRRVRQWFGTSLQRDKRNPKDDTQACENPFCTCSDVNTYSSDNKTVSKVWDTITHARHPNKELPKKSCICTNQSTQCLFLLWNFAVKYHNILKNVHIYFNSTRDENQDNKDMLHQCWRIQAADKCERSLKGQFSTVYSLDCFDVSCLVLEISAVEISALFLI